MLKNYITIAIRNLWKNKVFSFINIAGLMLGLACAILIILYAKDELSYDRFHVNNELYRIVTRWYNPDGSLKSTDGNTGDLQGPRFANSIPEMKSFVRIQSESVDIRHGMEINSYENLSVDSNFFNVFSFPLRAGDAATCLQAPKSIVVSEEMAKKFFNSTDVVGKTLEVKVDDQFMPYSISAVSRKCPQNSSIKFDFLMKKTVSTAELQNDENWFNFFQNSFVTLIPGANIKTVEAKMKQVYESESKVAQEKMMEEYGINETAGYFLQPVTDMHLSREFGASNGLVDDSNPMYSYILSGIAIFILLIACINFINLSIARSLKRAKEIGVRKVIGSDRGQLMWQFMGESFLLCFIAFGLAILLAVALLPTFNHLANKALSFSYLMDFKLVGLYILMFFITGLIAGFYPAVMMSGFSPVDTLYGRFKLAGNFLLQKSLVILQFGLASFLIIGTIVIYLQFKYLVNTNLGYDDKNVVMVNGSMSREKANVFKQELLKHPIIESVGLKNGGFWETVAKVNGEQKIEIKYETVDEDYVPMFKLQVIEGRNFDRNFPSDSSHSVLVNESFVKEAGWKDPLNQIVDFWYRNEKYSVVGVVKDYHFSDLSQKIKPQLFTMRAGNRYGMANIKIKPGSETLSLKYIADTYKSIFPINAYSYRFMDAENRTKYASEAKWKQIILYSSILTIFISCIGLFGLASLSTEKRNKEIGVRKVLGASVASIVQLLTKDFLKLVSVSFLFSFPLAYYAAHKWLANYPYRIDLQIGIFVLTAFITIGIALFTVGWDSVKASMMNPVRSLKTE
ncbi:MAG: ABC transporter permease [Saprospiraceae bacterium]|jgi:putative ABC transport system permease protein|nr:ABC transporter permease [Saprospiraceae bacterium]MBK6478744.1 ABC transporter permease [Saprospiraceae bacterium]MBK6814239.1 ABC transporter permease [Saprospiraceae bacterium]MBK7373681.1 ABC transporter permease [Saprospiraceae bacterium]MBK7437352.1 ABC transporter permease [Saprospiraceae bacterium]